MRNNAFNICLTTLVAGVFGFFLRWLQLLNGFDDSGLARPGAVTALVFALYSLLVMAAFALVTRIYLKKKSVSEVGAEALRVPNVLPVAIMWAIAAVMAIACLVLMFGSDFARYPTMQRMTAALGIFSAVCLPFVLVRKAAPAAEETAEAKGDSVGVAGIAAVIPVLFCALWLVTSYRVESENPVLWSYVVEMLAIVGATLSFYYVAAYFYCRAKPLRCIVMLQWSCYLCLCTLMDAHSFAEKLLFGSLAAAFLVFQYVLLDNVKEQE